jgi:hypothetical protein
MWTATSNATRLSMVFASSTPSVRTLSDFGKSHQAVWPTPNRCVLALWRTSWRVVNLRIAKGRTVYPICVPEVCRKQRFLRITSC